MTPHSGAPAVPGRLVDQAMVDAFLALTGDDQWIHRAPHARGPEAAAPGPSHPPGPEADEEAEAEAEGDRGAEAGSKAEDAVIPGALLLSVTVAELGRALGYPPGTRSWQRAFDSVRFLRPAPVGSRLSLSAQELRRRSAGGGRVVTVVAASLSSDRVPAGPVLEGRFSSLMEPLG